MAVAFAGMKAMILDGLELFRCERARETHLLRVSKMALNE